MDERRLKQAQTHMDQTSPQAWPMSIRRPPEATSAQVVCRCAARTHCHAHPNVRAFEEACMGASIRSCPCRLAPRTRPCPRLPAYCRYQHRQMMANGTKTSLPRRSRKVFSGLRGRKHAKPISTNPPCGRTGDQATQPPSQNRLLKTTSATSATTSETNPCFGSAADPK